jgi:GH24 family phage-related lysozyme (muramidase)
MVNMMFNLGPRKFSGFKNMVRGVNALNYRKAHIEMLDSKWAKIDVRNRANRLANRWVAG